MSKLTAERLHEVLGYDPATGRFTRKDCAAPSRRQIASLTAVFSGAIAKAVSVHFCWLAAVSAGDRYGGCSHVARIAKYPRKGEPKYFDIACKRIADAVSRPDLFIDAAKREPQPSLLDVA